MTARGAARPAARDGRVESRGAGPLELELTGGRAYESTFEYSSAD
jgi:hypothetical protein